MDPEAVSKNPSFLHLRKKRTDCVFRFFEETRLAQFYSKIRLNSDYYEGF